MSEVIDGTWLKSQMTGKRGEKAALARAMCISSDMLSKVLKGERKIQPDELPAVMSFFGLKLVPSRSTEAALNEVLRQASGLNEQGLALLRQQISALANTPSLVKQDKEPPQK